MTAYAWHRRLDANRVCAHCHENVSAIAILSLEVERMAESPLVSLTPFSQAVLDNREPTVDARRGRRSQILLAACYEAARTGRAVDINPDTD